MNSLNYIGSKYTLYPSLKVHIDKLIKRINKSQIVFGDLFAGTGIVGYKIGIEHNAKIVANDIQYYSFVINKANLSTYSEEDIITINKFIKKYNNITGVQGFIYNNYSTHNNCERLYFSTQNAMKIDAIREQLEIDRKDTTENIYFYLLANLISSADKVANTSCVYGAYLKKLKKSAIKLMMLQELSKETKQVKIDGVVYCENVSKVKTEYLDIVYLDPPYNNRQYASNYHILETISRADNPILHGKTGLRDYSSQKSNFCVKGLVATEMKNLIKNINDKFVVISYNDEGLIKKEDFIKLLETFGQVEIIEIEYTKFKAQKGVDRDNTVEFLFVLDKSI